MDLKKEIHLKRDEFHDKVCITMEILQNFSKLKLFPL